MPILLNNLNHEDSQGNYLTLVAIRQGIVLFSCNSLLIIIIAAVECELKELNDIADDLYCSLQKYSGAVEEGTRNVLSECLGRTVVAKPELCSRLQVLIFIGHCLLFFQRNVAYQMTTEFDRRS